MCLIIKEDVFKKQRADAKLRNGDPAAEALYKNLSVRKRIKMYFTPIRVGHVEFEPWPPEIKSKAGLPRRLPLYLFRHGDHISADYAHGFPGQNERVECHCGNNCYFASTYFSKLRLLLLRLT